MKEDDRMAEFTRWNPPHNWGQILRVGMTIAGEAAEYKRKLEELEKRNADNLGGCSTGMCWRQKVKEYNK